jgi:hypothetical protein
LVHDRFGKAQYPVKKFCGTPQYGLLSLYFSLKGLAIRKTLLPKNRNAAKGNTEQEYKCIYLEHA